MPVVTNLCSVKKVCFWLVIEESNLWEGSDKSTLDSGEKFISMLDTMSHIAECDDTSFVNILSLILYIFSDYDIW